MKPLRILHTISGRGLGGPKTVFLSHQKLFASLGIDSIPVLRPRADLMTQAGKSVRTISYNRLFSPALQPWAVAAIQALVKEVSPDVIWLHKPIDAFFWRQALPSAKIVLVVHGFQDKYLDCADHLVAVSQAVGDHLTRKGHHHYTVMPNFIEQEITNHPVQFRKPLRVGSFGYFRRKKGFSDLLETYSLLKAWGFQKKIQGTLWGHGTLSLYLKGLWGFMGLKDILQIKTWAENAYDEMKALDIVVVPSRSESFGMVVVEAMAAGSLVIATRSGGPETIIDHGVTGLLVSKKDPMAMAHAIRAVIENPDEFVSIREAGREKVSSTYTYAQAQNTLKQIVRELLEK